MPIKVEPSKSVVIDWSEYDPDNDLLRVRMEDGRVAYISRTTGKFPCCVLDASFIPQEITDLSLAMVRQLLFGLSKNDKAALRGMFGSRADSSQSLAEYTAEKLRTAAMVVCSVIRYDPAGEEHPLDLDIRLWPRVRLNYEIDGIHVSRPSRATWCWPSPIESITSIDRFDAELERARE